MARWGTKQSFVEETVQVHTTEAGHRYIEFRCCRLVLTEGQFSRVFPDLGDSFDALRALQPGLSEQEARSRLMLTGANTIPFSMDTW
jgi:hypothetical protein